MANNNYILNWSDIAAEPIDVRGKNTLSTNSYSLDDLHFSINDSGFLIVKNSHDEKIILKNYSSVKYLIDSSNKKYNLISESKIYNYENIISETKNGKLSGTKYNDKLTGTSNNDKILGYEGNDIIYSSKGNDTITGGIGENTIEYNGEFGSDTIKLTSKENLILDLTSYNSETTDIKYSVKNDGLILDVYQENTLIGSIKLKDFNKKNIVGANGSVTLKIANDEPVNLNTFNLLTYNEKHFTTKNTFTGSRFNETINATMVKNNTTIKGGAGYNTIIGTNGYNDTITGGNDGNNISTGNGNKTITTGAGNDDITITGNGSHIIKAGNGINHITINGEGTNKITTGLDNDEVYIGGTTKTSTLSLGKGKNTVTIDNTEKFGEVIITEQKVNAVNVIKFTETINEDYYLYKNKNDLQIIKNNDSSCVTLKSFFSAPKKQATYKFIIDDKTLSIDEFMALTDGFYIYGKKTIKGTKYSDTILADDSIDGTKGYNDNIYPNTGTDTINAGVGKNKIYLFKGDGRKTILNGKGEDTLVFSSGAVLNFDYNNNDLIINYGNNDDIVTIKDYSNSSVKYIKIGKIVKDVSFYANFINSGDKAKQITITNNIETELILNNKLNNEEYRYSLKSKQGEQTINIEYLANGRLFITGDNVEIKAYTNQNDDIILLGNNNTLDTGNENDIVRLGNVLDANGKYYSKRSDANIIKLGDGNDHITYYGLDNDIDTGDGYDTALNIVFDYDISEDNIKNSELLRAMNNISYETLDYQIGEFTQGNEGGDCRLFAMLQSLGMNKNFESLKDYVEITVTDNNYNLTFKNYTGGNNNITISKEELADYNYVFGDLDIVLIDYGLNKLLKERGTSVQDANYNMLSEYFFNNGDITYTDQNDDYTNRLYEQWEAYKNGTISNITFGILSDSSNSKLGIVGEHAYSIYDLDDTVITLINPWDNQDKLTIDLSVLNNYRPCIITYGTNYYNENRIILNSQAPDSKQSVDLSEIQESTANWLTEKTDGIYIDNNTYSPIPTESILTTAIELT